LENIDLLTSWFSKP